MTVSLRKSGTTEHPRLRIALGLAMVLFVCGRGPLAVAKAEEAGAPQQAEQQGQVVAEPAEGDSPIFAARKSGQSPVISGPRELLRRHGVDDSHFEGLTDWQPVGGNENETLLKVMFWMRDFRRPDVEQWARDGLNLARLAKDPEADRGQLFLLSGRVTRVERRQPAPEVAERLELKQYYRCELVLDELVLGDRQQRAVVFAADVPKRWQAGEPIDERASAFGLFLKFAGKDPGRPLPVFVTRHMAWYPPTPLGKLGMDVGLLDSVVDRTGLGRSRRSDQPQEVLRAGREREAFYALLAAAGRAKPGQLLRQAGRQLKRGDGELIRTDQHGDRYFSVEPLFLDAPNQHGRLVSLSGRVRRVVRIDVEDADIVDRFRLDHYYEISLFTDDSQNNPLIFCVRELPPGMPTGDGPEYGEWVRVAGFFFKLWSYPIPDSDLLPETQRGPSAFRQPAPLLIGRRPVWYPQEPAATSHLADAIAAGLFVLALFGVWIALWRSGRSDRRFHDQTIAKTHAVDPGVSLNEIGLGVDGAVDFSGLEGTDGGTDVGK